MSMPRQLVRLAAITATIVAAHGGSLLSPQAAAQIIIGGGARSGGVIIGGAILFGPPIPPRPPLAAFHATIAEAGPRTSSGLIIYETPGLIWTCEAMNCGSQGRLDRLNMETCVELGRKVGPITTLEAAGRGFAPDGIAACNNAIAGVAAPTIIAPPSNGGQITFPGQ